MKIIEFNNLFYLKNNTYEFDWAPDDWFPLNETTREHFKKDILPLIKSGECSITKDLYDKIKHFKQNQENNITTISIIEPKNIILEPHQTTAVTYMMKYNKFGLFLGTGTGKTLIAITWLLNVKPLSCLIVTPQKVVGQYKEELDKYIPGNNYEVTNYEQLHHFLNNTYEALIIDESHKAKSLKTKINFNLTTIAQSSKYIYLFTGTPQDKKRFEILAQLNILDQRIIPENTKTKMMDRYFYTGDYYQPTTEKKQFSEELTKLINAYTWGMKTEDAIDLTPQHHYIVHCDHPQLYYDDLVKHHIVYKNNSWVCVADTPAKKKIKSSEIATGFILWKNTNVEDEDYLKEQIEYLPNTKDDKLRMIVKQLTSGIIYYQFTANIQSIQKILDEEKRTYVIVNGLISQTKSTELTNKFKENKVEFLIIQSQSGNAGLNFTNTNNIIFYSLPLSYIVFHQCQSRIKRIGQIKDTNYFYLLSTDTVEEAVFRTLKKKKSFTDRLYQQYLSKEASYGRTNKRNNN